MILDHLAKGLRIEVTSRRLHRCRWTTLEAAKHDSDYETTPLQCLEAAFSHKHVELDLKGLGSDRKKLCLHVKALINEGL